VCPNKHKGYIVFLNKLMSHILCANKHIGYVIFATAGGLLAFPGSDSDIRSVSVITVKKETLLKFLFMVLIDLSTNPFLLLVSKVLKCAVPPGYLLMWLILFSAFFEEDHILLSSTVCLS
jgi:hypothetical protein